MKTSFIIDADGWPAVRVEPVENGVLVSQVRDRIEMNFADAVELGEALRIVGLEGLRKK